MTSEHSTATDQLRLTRRDALLAALGGGAAAVAGIGVAESGFVTGTTTESIDIDTLHHVAVVVYPDEVDPTEAFLQTYVDRLTDHRTSQVASALAGLDQQSRNRYGRHVVDLSSRRVDALLRELGVSRAASVPDGTLAERVRYHVVNALLYALYTSPTGSQLAHIDNPVGYPGGFYSVLEGAQ